MQSKSPGSEQRQFVRIKRNYIIRFHVKGTPTVKYEISQIDNISKGGMKFMSSVFVEKGTLLGVELRTPYISETVYVEGEILESKEKVPGILYENRFKFGTITPATAEVLEKVEKYNLKDGK